MYSLDKSRSKKHVNELGSIAYETIVSNNKGVSIIMSNGLYWMLIYLGTNKGYNLYPMSQI